MQKKRPTILELKIQQRKQFTSIAELEASLLWQKIRALETDIVRLIQIQDQQKTLKEEEGFKDYTGLRHPGVRDRIEQSLVGLSLYDGVELEDYTIYLTSGKGPDRVDPVELLRLGVSDSIIKQATIEGQPWTSVTCRKRGARND